MALEAPVYLLVALIHAGSAPCLPDRCTCVPAEEATAVVLREELEHVGAVFAGVVERIDVARPDSTAGFVLEELEVVLRVSRSWKGASRRVVVRTPADAAACGYEFVAGEAYVVFADQNEDGTLFVTSCGRTAREEDARAIVGLLDAISPLEVPDPRGGAGGPN